MRCWVVDAFTDRAFRGNPAGVVLLDPAAPTQAAWMQDVAAEFRHSETAFVTPRADGAYDLRWFTPSVEVDLCGHATLAAAHALLSTGADGPFVFHTRSGALTATTPGSGDGPGSGSIELDFPARVSRPLRDRPGLADALGARPRSVHSAADDILAELDDEAAVAGLDPDFDALARLPCRGVIVTARAAAGTDADFVSRFFAVSVGVDEDPVTGSAHCALGPYWAARLGRPALTGRQLSARGGRVGVMVRGDRVLLRGQAVTVLAGELLVS